MTISFKPARSVIGVWFFLFGLIFICGSCNRFLDVPSPKTLLVTQKIFEDAGTANAALTNIYSRMANGSITYQISVYCGITSDELRSYSTNKGMAELYFNRITSGNDRVSIIWNGAYSFIFQANSIIEGLSNSTLPNVLKQHLLGEAKFIRAFWYFYLINLFGDVPYLTTTSYSANAVAVRETSSTIYTSIVRELVEAKDLVSDEYVGADGVTISGERVRVNTWVVQALLARVCLYLKDYENAELYASNLIGNKVNFALDSNLNDVFIKNSREAIFQLQPAGDGVNTWEGTYFMLTRRPSTGEGNSSEVSNTLLEAFDLDDKRRNNWVGSVNVASGKYNFPFKYKVGRVLEVTEYPTILRLAEQYLIRSEARLKRGDISNAIEDINVIRKRAGLASISSKDTDSLFTSIMHERQVELFTELGHRWLDLKRVGWIDSSMIIAANLKGSTWKKEFALWPIPMAERSLNSNLTQNVGYE